MDEINQSHVGQAQRANVDFIPLLWFAPERKTPTGVLQLVIWLPGFGGSKEHVEPQLRQLAQAGFLALSFDPFQHGERGVETSAELTTRVVSNIRRHFWPILAQTALDVLRVVDWAVETLEVESQVSIGGISMGGDIAIAAAGIDSRITRVAAAVATPDWLRPGSCEPPGAADAYAQRLYDLCNPLTNLQNYQHKPAITFQCGAIDNQVPADGAQRFIQAIAEYSGAQPKHLDICLHDGVRHAFTDEMWQNCRRWLTKSLPESSVNS